ncbi:hypothetical protein [Nocardia alni]|uniref:hypothetical protein n=1 Tax=Nocardia alni TaxID=2815723 RepID=UPI001C24A157|nr:hypothetical protein [Nocardia alni]
MANFYAAYIDAISDRTDDLSTQLRAHYMTSELQQQLETWEAANDGDGVLLSGKIPTEWDVKYHDAGMGHIEMSVTLTWGSGTGAETSKLAVRILADGSQLLTNIEAAPASW